MCRSTGVQVLAALTAVSRLSALGMCSRSTKGCLKNSAKVILASGRRSSRRSSRSLQSWETRVPGGSWRQQGHDLSVQHLRDTMSEIYVITPTPRTPPGPPQNRVDNKATIPCSI